MSGRVPDEPLPRGPSLLYTPGVLAPWLWLLLTAAVATEGLPSGGGPAAPAVQEDLHPTAGTPGQAVGDLWPSCWSDDDALYAANGDGRGFARTSHVYDIAVGRIAGPADRLKGSFLAGGDQVGSVFGGPLYYRKPTGMLCLGGAIYMAVQNLTKTLRYADASNLSVSFDKGRTWHWNRSKPMFPGGVFTTIFFLDFGKDSRDAVDGYVYAYGLDRTWSFQHDLYLARVPRRRVMDRAAWRFFAGMEGGRPRFVADIRSKKPVLHDARLVYPHLYDAGPLSQGGVTYIRARERYLYSSWTELTHEFYEAPRPWGPWRFIHETDFGRYPWSAERVGGYATTIPSKFVSRDGRAMWLQSNCFGSSHHCADYFYSLRRLTLDW